MFALRDLGTDESVLALASAFTSPPVDKPSTTASTTPLYHSALLKHEVAFVLGQLQNTKAIPALTQALADAGETPMVRHEAAEALGAIAEKVLLVILTMLMPLHPPPNHANLFHRTQYLYCSNLPKTRNQW
jgi:deoxyhypusine monooxygenase